MTEADILARTYTDLCSIYRPTSKKLPTGETVQLRGLAGDRVASCVPCALAKHGGGKLQRSPSTASAPTEYVVFFRPEVDVRAGDLLVITHLGHTAAYDAGEADRHMSHTAVPVKMAKETV